MVGKAILMSALLISGWYSLAIVPKALCACAGAAVLLGFNLKQEHDLVNETNQEIDMREAERLELEDIAVGLRLQRNAMEKLQE